MIIFILIKKNHIQKIIYYIIQNFHNQLNYTMFGWVDFREDGKVWRENRRENEKGCCLVRREERKIFGGVQAFSTRAHLKLVSSKWRENSMGGVLWLNNKIAHCSNFVPLFFFFFFCLLFWAFAPIKALFIIYYYYFHFMRTMPTLFFIFLNPFFFWFSGLYVVLRCFFFKLDMIFFSWT